MVEPGQNLTDLRDGIDKIDTAIHDYLIQRAALVEEIARAKGGSSAILRPGREAKIMRRLLARHHGAFPETALVRIWREIISASVCMQGTFTMALSEADKEGPLGALARKHFGMVAPISGQRNHGAAVQAVMDGKATVALLPLPGHEAGLENSEPWWRFLAHPQENTPRVIARLPFFGPAESLGPEALVIAQAPQEESGDDRSLLLLETREELSRAALKKRLDQAGFLHQAPGIWADTAGRRLHLVEVEGFVEATDPRLRRLELADKDLFLQRHVAGAFAQPLKASPGKTLGSDKCEETA